MESAAVILATTIGLSIALLSFATARSIVRVGDTIAAYIAARARHIYVNSFKE